MDITSKMDTSKIPSEIFKPWSRRNGNLNILSFVIVLIKLQ